MRLCHGSMNKIEKPQYGLGSPYNDYGLGFYCTESLDMAKEWSVAAGRDGFANEYDFDIDGLMVLDLSDAKFNVLNWLAVLIANRKFSVSAPVMERGKEWIVSRYGVDTAPYDVIRGWRANDSYFSFARAFLGNTISLRQLSYAMKLGKLGEQIVLKRAKAFDRLRFVDAIPVSAEEYYPKRKARDDEARASFFAEESKGDVGGRYLIDLMREG